METVKTKSGFEIDIDPSQLTIAGQETPIELTIKECLHQDALIAANAATISNGLPLESAGSYYIVAKQNNAEIAIKRNGKLKIRSKKTDNNIKVFYGNRDANGSMNWNVSNSKPSIKKIQQAVSGLVQAQKTDQIKIGDSVRKRPCTLTECIKLHYDSTMTARWNYTIGNRKWMNRKQEIAYGLRPVDFPYSRFKRGIVLGDTSSKKITVDYKTVSGFYCGNSQEALSKMYMKNDTVPVFKDTVYSYYVNGDEAVYDLFEENEINQLGWINIDKFYDTPLCDSTTIDINTDLQSYKTYFKFLNRNSVLIETNAKGVFSNEIMSNQKLPIGEQVEVLIVGIKNKVVYSNKQVFVVKKRNNWKIKLDPHIEKQV